METQESPQVVYLTDPRDFDSIKHQDVLIQFPPGGVVGDGAWRLQFLHNLNVMVSQDKKEIKLPDHVAILHVHLAEPWIIANICMRTYVNEILVDEYEHIEMLNEFFTDKPSPSGNVYLKSFELTGKARNFENAHKIHSFYVPQNIQIPGDYRATLEKFLSLQLVSRETLTVISPESFLINKDEFMHVVLEGVCVVEWLAVRPTQMPGI